MDTSAAQTGTNVSTTIANNMMNNVNQNTPDGSLNYSYDDNYTWTDPYTGQSYTIPLATANQTLSPTGQAISNANQNTRLNMANVGSEQSARLRQLLGQPVNISGAPSAGQAGNYSQFRSGPQLATEFGDAGDITRSYSTDFSQDRQRVEDALFERLEDRMGTDRNSLEQRLANQGIRAGSGAYSRAQQDFDQSTQEARLSAILGAGQEQSRLVGMEAQRANFQNAAQNQDFGQLFQRANFGNAGRQQMHDNYFRQNAANNDIASRTFGEMNTNRGQYLNEQYANRNQSINELIGLMSGSQVQNPNFVNTQQSQIPYTDNAGLINNAYNQQVNKAMAEYQAGGGLFGGLMGGLGTLGSAWLSSDERLKTDIDRIGETDDGQPLYSYRYKGEGPDVPVRIGLMAQDVEQVHPEAVREVGGFKQVHYGRALGV